MNKNLRLGTRGSPLALVQAEMLRGKIAADTSNEYDKDSIEIVPIRTSGDWRTEHKERMFLEMGGDKGLFTKELEEALLAGHIDIAIHSMKDVPSILPDGLEIAAMLERADPRDAFISQKAKTLDELPPGAVIGSSSLRRQAQILARRPDLRVTALRGNVDTRLRKLADGAADATILALAGLVRLGSREHVASILEPEIMLPSAGQGALGVEMRSNNDEMRHVLNAINCKTTSTCVAAERALITVLDGSCHTPLAAYATLDGDRLKLEAMAARPDGTSVIRMRKDGAVKDALTIGRELGEELKSRLPADFFVRAA